MVRLGTYAAASVVATMGVIYHAFASRQQFYPAMVYLSTSKINLVLLLNMAFVILYSLWQLVKVVFLGQLREAEVERLNEQLWRELMEVLFAMTIFREEFNVSFVAMVTVLLFIKAFHWLAQKRVEYIEITPSVSRLSHFRISGFMFFLLILDAIFAHSSVGNLLKTRKPSVSLFFAFEYVILATSVISMVLKYTLYMGDMWMEGQWDNKAVYIFYLELIRDLLHLSLYLFFFLVIFLHYGLPLHLVRELYEIIRNFKARVTDFIRYRKVTSNMNERFPDATPEELGRSDATCIICREEMAVAKKLPCGHLFHVHCLRSWLERQQTCPTCRAPVIPPETTSSDSVAQREQQQNQSTNEGQANNNTTEGNAPAQAPVNAAQARLQAAAAAAARYSSSFVYPSVHSGTMNWYPMYVPAVPQQTVQSSGTSTTTEAESPLEDSANNSPQKKAGQVYFMPVIAGGGACWPTHLKADEKSKYLESTVQLLRQQLDAALELQRSVQDNKGVEEQQSNLSSEEETPHDRKGKFPVKSGVGGEQEASSSSL